MRNKFQVGSVNPVTAISFVVQSFIVRLRSDGRNLANDEPPKYELVCRKLLLNPYSSTDAEELFDNRLVPS